MALDNAAKLGGAYVEITARMDRLHSDLAEVRQRVGGLGSAFSAIGGAGTAAFAAIAAASLGAIKSIKEFASLEAATATTNMVFGSSAKQVTAEADRMAATFGVVKSQYLESANALGMTLKNMKMTKEEAARLSMGLNQLAGDMAATFDKPVVEATNALKAVFRGEFDPLEQFGPSLTAARIEAVALREGFTKLGGELSRAAKGFAALKIIQEETKDSQGAMAREVDQLGSQLKRASGNFLNMAAELGGALAPAVQGFLGLLEDLGEQFGWVWSSALGGIQAVSSGVSEMFATAGVILRNFGDFWEIAGLKAYELGLNIAEVGAAIMENLARIGSWIGSNWREMIADGLNAIWSIFQNLGHNIGEFAHELWQFLTDPTSEWDPDFSPLLQGFEATTAQFPEMMRAQLSSVQDEIDAVSQRIQDREGLRAAADKVGPKPIPLELDKEAWKKADAAMKAATGAPLKVEILEGPSSLSRKLQEAVSGSGAQQIQQEQLNQQKETAKATKETAEAIKKIADRPGGSAVAVLG